MLYEVCAYTHPGLRRDHNEDSVAFDAAWGLWALADGMGGYNAGKVASRMAMSLVVFKYVRWLASGGAQAGPQVQCNSSG